MAENPADVVARWKRGVQASTGKYKEKIMAITVSPAQQALAAKDKYRAGVEQALADGTWEAGLAGVDFQAWKKKTADVGSTRISSGAEAATDKMTVFMTQLLPYTDGVKRQIAAMPSVTPDDRDQRALAAIRLMRQFKPRKK